MAVHGEWYPRPTNHLLKDFLDGRLLKSVLSLVDIYGMKRSAVVALFIGLGAGACGGAVPQAIRSTSIVTTVVSTTSTSLPAPTTTLRTTTTTRRITTTPTTTTPATSPPLATIPTTSAPVLTAAEANYKLCGQIEYADQAIMSGNFLAGGLRLASGISNYGDAADPGLVQLARDMLSAGKAGDADGYVAKRSQAASTCALLGRPIVVGGGLQCITAPCP